MKEKLEAAAKTMKQQEKEIIELKELIRKLIDQVKRKEESKNKEEEQEKNSPQEEEKREMKNYKYEAGLLKDFNR